MQNLLLSILVCLLSVNVLHAASAERVVAQIEGVSRLTEKGQYRVFLHPPPAIDINRYQTWGVYLEDVAGNALNGVDLKVSADMPAHGHGLLTYPKVRPGGAPGRYRIEGLRFHMPGYWEIRLQVRHQGKQDGLIVQVELE